MDITSVIISVTTKLNSNNIDAVEKYIDLLNSILQYCSQFQFRLSKKINDFVNSLTKKEILSFIDDDYTENR